MRMSPSFAWCDCRAFALVFVCLISAGGNCDTTEQGVDQHDVAWLLPLVDDHAILVATIRPASWEVTAFAVRARSMLPSVRGSTDVWLARAKTIQKKLADAQIRQLAVIVSAKSGRGLSPAFVVPNASQLDGPELLGLIPDRYRHTYVVKHIGGLWVAGTQQFIQHLQESIEKRSISRFRYAFAIHAKKSVGRGGLVVGFLSADHKRAIREWGLAMPEWLGGGPAARWCDVAESISVAFDMGGKFGVTLLAETPSSSDAPKLLTEIALLSKSVLTDLEVADADDVERLNQSWKVGDRGVSLTIDSETEGFRQLSQTLVPRINHLLDDHVRQLSLRRMKTVILLLLNHDSAYKILPPAGGIPVPKRRITGNLSWRVYALPFNRAYGALYEEFHLDEPWDSKHNKKLIPRMPAMFLMPNSKLTPEQGLSNICVPTGPDTMWPMDQTLTVDDIKDGTGQTIALLEVRDDQAQVWTKPTKLEIDVNDLASYLGGHFKDEFLMVRANGAMGFSPLSMSPDEFARLLTRASGD